METTIGENDSGATAIKMSVVKLSLVKITVGKETVLKMEGITTLTKRTVVKVLLSS
jgi:hypothetical protein